MTLLQQECRGSLTQKSKKKKKTVDSPIGYNHLVFSEHVACIIILKSSRINSYLSVFSICISDSVCNPDQGKPFCCHPLFHINYIHFDSAIQIFNNVHRPTVHLKWSNSQQMHTFVSQLVHTLTMLPVSDSFGSAIRIRNTHTLASTFMAESSLSVPASRPWHDGEGESGLQRVQCTHARMWVIHTRHCAGGKNRIISNNQTQEKNNMHFSRRKSIRRMSRRLCFV